MQKKIPTLGEWEFLTIEIMNVPCGLFSLCFLSSRCLSSSCLLSLGSLGSSLLATTTTGALGSLRSLCHVLVEVDELDEANVGSIALTMTELDDLLESLNLSFGTDISKYKLDKE